MFFIFEVLFVVIYTGHTILIYFCYISFDFDAEIRTYTQLCVNTASFFLGKMWCNGDRLRGGEVVSRRAHNPEVAGSIPAPAS